MRTKILSLNICRLNITGIFIVSMLIPSAIFSQRKLVDTVGFAQYSWQMDSIFARIPQNDKVPAKSVYKMAICPHDDYSYAAGLYANTLSGIKANTVIMIGVAHKAKVFGLENRLVFDNFKEWRSAGGNIRVTAMREKLLDILSPSSYIVHDSMMQNEHSLEAITPFLKRNNSKVEILPILVPYMTFQNMEVISSELALRISQLMIKNHLTLGKDVAIVISNDGLHYGDEDWGGANMAPFGTDSSGTAKAIAKDHSIIDDCLKGEVNNVKIRKFFDYTVSASNFKEYSWTWCGRYSVPFGLMLTDKLNRIIVTFEASVNKSSSESLLIGEVTGYRSSISTPHIEVRDLNMGTTAPANQRHWVSYVGVVFK